MPDLLGFGRSPRLQPGLSDGVAAGKEGDFVTLLGQFFDERAYHEFGAALSDGGTRISNGTIMAIRMVSNSYVGKLGPDRHHYT